MECQREAQPRGRVLLTDQALVAVTIARSSAQAHGRGASGATSADVLVGLATEPEGWAGHLLRRREAALVALSGRLPSLPPGLTTLDVVLRHALAAADQRPPGTRDVLLAVLADGGGDLHDLLTGCGIDPDDLRPADGGEQVDARNWAASAEVLWAANQETVTFTRDEDPPLEAPARRTVGRVRAAGGGAVDLVLALAANHAEVLPAALTRISAPALATAREALEPVRDAPPSWDAGLDAVLAATAVLTEGREARPSDLLRAALVAGGSGPLAVLERARTDGDARS